jgi:hypothetical protein
MPGPLKVVLKPDRAGRKEPALWDLQRPILRATDQGFVLPTALTLLLFLTTLPSCLEEKEKAASGKL